MKKDSTTFLTSTGPETGPVKAEYSCCEWRQQRWELCVWSQLAYLQGEDTSSPVGSVENGVEREVPAKWAPHLAPRAIPFKHNLAPEVKGKPKHLHSAGP